MFISYILDNPSQPSNVSVARDSNQTVLSWTQDKLEDIDHFEVYVGMDPPRLTGRATVNLPVKRNNITARIVAVNKCGQRSEELHHTIQSQELVTSSPEDTTFADKFVNFSLKPILNTELLLFLFLCMIVII